ncbi:ThuA domain-containing protein [Streptomyces sp. DSM 40750]|uniref:ThuA domain-containing protein n=1 Tax=Streptomyces sp. DSM 40750 TaxID=2801030 RepID=UPI00214B99F4|nr:ThuA domain-containing protein [Streptomyces sp. DSM 40750]UUU19406.1 ThuA domain-containing protein [Streptomyces sp. DSM 40750]UUU27250.1 ThuA domain-containing protein [Streptomyces sp. DSM 40750]
MAGPAGRLDAVMVCGGRWHDFDHARLRLLELLGEHPRVRTAVYQDYDCVAALDKADLLVTYTCDVRPRPAQRAALARFVERGGRWLALHGTNAVIEPSTSDGPRTFTTPRLLGELAQVLGSQFLAHPPIEPYEVRVTRPDHPLVAGIGPFTVTDELYVCELHGEPEVLLHAEYTGPCRGFAEGDTAALDSAPRPVLYLKRHGLGEVCYFTLGHCRGRYDMQDLGVDDTGRVDAGPWETPEFLTVLRRCVERVVGVRNPAEERAGA